MQIMQSSYISHIMVSAGDTALSADGESGELAKQL
jgi:hypothetical protein